MTVETAYVVFCAAGLPFWVIQQPLGGRSIPFVLASCAYVIYLIFSGVNIPMDNITLITGCIAAWLTASLVWTDTKQSIFELFNMLSYFLLFTAARKVPIGITALTVFATGVAFASVQMYRTAKHNLPEDTFFCLGNGNHTAAFMLISLFAGAWLTINLSIWILPFVLLIASALFLTRCKGAILGVIVGAIITLCVAGMWQAAALICLAVMAFGLRRYTSIPNLKRSTCGRIFLYLGAVEMIIKRPVTGWGLNMYRKELPDINAKIIRSPIYRKISEKANIDLPNRSHRVHNDHLELMAELGIPGYVLFVYLFLHITYDPIALGLLAAFAICACFFFPLREVHTAAPFWAVMGSVAGGTISAVHLPWLVIVIIACIIFAVIIQTLRVFLGQWYSEMARTKPNITEKEKLEFIDTALLHVPYNTGYLSDAAYYYSKVDPVKAFFYAARGLLHYDGGRVKQGIYDMFARTLIGATESKVCHAVEDKALYLDPEFAPATVIKNYLFKKRRQND
jgi:O-antigen ligase